MDLVAIILFIACTLLIIAVGLAVGSKRRSQRVLMQNLQRAQLAAARQAGLLLHVGEFRFSAMPEGIPEEDAAIHEVSVTRRVTGGVYDDLWSINYRGQVAREDGRLTDERALREQVTAHPEAFTGPLPARYLFDRDTALRVAEHLVVPLVRRRLEDQMAAGFAVEGSE
ncbi:hypothetical protein JOF53_006558 [Crossiella equi]|uniref:Uncharacterized protein n=1 Tax=Crossiella equi TaxID=130796 RepID=A0ABS5AM99_9PSEU|nr:hypothetical protein [Crossiella equi]MBP2477686.1 hypothetical protein [Crossiella equi]